MTESKYDREPDLQGMIADAATAIHNAFVAKGGYRGGAEAALAVFEKAHTPTDDEREARAYSSPEAVAIAQRYLDRERRHSEVPKSSAECFEGILDRATLDEYLRVDPEETYERLVVKANALASTVRRLLETSEPQGEPSDPNEHTPACDAWADMNGSGCTCHVEQGEPSEHRDRIALAEFIDKALDGDAGYGVGAFLAGGILSFLSNRADLHAAFAQGEPSDAQYPEVDAFAERMRAEMVANAHKGDQWRRMTPRQAWGEISWHLGKLTATLKAEDVPAIRELAADIANGAMMLDQIVSVYESPAALRAAGGEGR